MEYLCFACSLIQSDLRFHSLNETGRDFAIVVTECLDPASDKFAVRGMRPRWAHIGIPRVDDVFRDFVDLGHYRIADALNLPDLLATRDEVGQTDLAFNNLLKLSCKCVVVDS